MLGVLSVFSLDFIALECLEFEENRRHVYYTTVILWCVIPLIIALCILLAGLIKYAKVATLSQAEYKLAVRHISDQHSWMLLLLSYLVLPAVSNKQLQVFDCITLESKKTYLRSDTSIDCESNGYVEFRGIVCFFIALYQLIPVTWMAILLRKKDLLNPPVSSHDKQLGLFIRDNNPDLCLIRFLFIDYKCSKWWFEIAEMYRRIIFIGVVPLVSANPGTRASFGCVLAILSVAYFREEQPYRVGFTNVIAHIAQVKHIPTYKLILLVLIAL